jgi:adenylate cyclase
MLALDVVSNVMDSNDEPVDQANILVVDDTPDNLRLLSTILTRQGYQVRKALNAQRALTTIQQSLPDLILLDIMMPDMDGYELCQKLKENSTTREIPIIFISALDGVSDKVKAFEFGGNDYITKPFKSAEVVVRVANQLTILNQRRQLQQQAQQLEAQNQQLQQEIKERQRAELALQLAQEKSERLLLNILPKTIIERLKQCEGTLAERFESVTVLLADIVGFTPFSARISPLELVNILNQIFSEFDELTEKHGLEKIKTIGDAYMVVGGLPIPSKDHSQRVAKMALDMQTSIANFKTDRGEPFQIRIGINTGPVVAGVIGTKKFIYDLWGDTVNVASRMESHGSPGGIQVSSTTYEHIKDLFLLVERGEIEIKGKGNMMTYWLKGVKNG